MPHPRPDGSSRSLQADTPRPPLLTRRPRLTQGTLETVAPLERECQRHTHGGDCRFAATAENQSTTEQVNRHPRTKGGFSRLSEATDKPFLPVFLVHQQRRVYLPDPVDQTGL